MTVQHEGVLLRHPVVKQNRVFAAGSQIKAPKTAPAVRKVYGENSDNSDYGELRAIVRRIEMNQNESKSDNHLMLQRHQQSSSSPAATIGDREASLSSSGPK